MQVTIWALNLRELSKKQKLYAAIIIVGCMLIFYGLGIATNFFAQPMFSMFFIISDSTAHNVVTYVALVIGIALTMGVTVGLVKKRKSTFLEADNKPVIGTIKASNEVPVRINPTPNDQKITTNAESKKTVQKTQSAKNPIPTMQVTKQTTPKVPPQPSTVKSAAANPKAVVNKDRITCPTCQKEFGTPLFSLDYNSGNTKLIGLCPYCYQPVDSETKMMVNGDLWNKYAPKP